MEILSTKNYSLFKILDCNRPLDDRHVRKLIKAIEEKNLLPLNPITVNEKLEVIDGQHRLKAAKVLRTEIYYVISESVSTNDIFALNSNKKNWSPADYLKFHIAAGKHDYILIGEFLNKFPAIPLSPALQLLSPNLISYGVKFKDGVFKIENFENATAIATQLYELSKTHIFALTSTFIRSYLVVAQLPGFDFNRLVQQIAKQPRSFVPCVNREQYWEMLEDLYNCEKKHDNRLSFTAA